MAALLVALSVMAVMLTVALPVWTQAARREKEAELIFRGQQYARAIGLFQRRNGPGTLPPTIDVLVEQRFLRKKYKDPITNDDFQQLLAGQPVLGGQQASTGQGELAAGGRGSPTAPGRSTPLGGGAGGGIIGVTSKSTETSVRLYQGRTHYNEWTFVYVAPARAPGRGDAGGVPGAGGQRSGVPAGGGSGVRGGPSGSGPRDAMGPARPLSPSGSTVPGSRSGR